MLENRTLTYNKYIEERINSIFDLAFNFAFNNMKDEEVKSIMISERNNFNFDGKISFIQDFFNNGILSILESIHTNQDFVNETVSFLDNILIFIYSLKADKFEEYARNSKGSVA